jgi:hypothetical protein
MGIKTRFMTAIFGAVLMFFLGTQMPSISAYVSMHQRSIARWWPLAVTSARSGGSSGGGSGGSSSGSGGGDARVGAPSGGRSSKPDTQSELLRLVLADDERALCSVR